MFVFTLKMDFSGRIFRYQNLAAEGSLNNETFHLNPENMRCRIYDQRINFIDNEGSFVSFVKFENFFDAGNLSTKLLHRSLFIGQMFSHSWISVATAERNGISLLN
jgi:hypothetical protein